MPDDKRPDPRFAMIAEELTTEVKPNVVEVPSIARNGGVECPRCGMSAFEPMAALGDGVPRLACLACPPPAPVYSAPEWAALKVATNRYRCSRCGERPWVSATLRDINLHCRQCRQLTFHSLQAATMPPPSGSPDRRSVRKVNPQEFADDLIALRAIVDTRETFRRADEGLASEPLDAEALRAEFAVDAARPSIISSQGAVTTAGNERVRALVKAMLSIAGLMDFDAYAEFAINQVGVTRPLNARERQTGRTWRGIFDLLALHYLAREAAPNRTCRVFVIGGSGSVDKWLRREVFDVRNRLGNVEPTFIEVLPNAGDVRCELRKLRAPLHSLLYADHTFYENRLRPTDPGLTYKP